MTDGLRVHYRSPGCLVEGPQTEVPLTVDIPGLSVREDCPTGTLVGHCAGTSLYPLSVTLTTYTQYFLIQDSEIRTSQALDYEEYKSYRYAYTHKYHTHTYTLYNRCVRDTRTHTNITQTSHKHHTNITQTSQHTHTHIIGVYAYTHIHQSSHTYTYNRCVRIHTHTSVITHTHTYNRCVRIHTHTHTHKHTSCIIDTGTVLSTTTGVLPLRCPPMLFQQELLVIEGMHPHTNDIYYNTLVPPNTAPPLTTPPPKSRC